MKAINYCYNYSFLRDWLYSNREFKKSDIVKALDVKGWDSVNKYVSGDLAMPIEKILRFCNYFQVPVDNFFLDANGQLAVRCEVRPVLARHQTEPTNGYNEGNERGGRHRTNPATDGMVQSVIPYTDSEGHKMLVTVIQPGEGAEPAVEPTPEVTDTATYTQEQYDQAIADAVMKTENKEHKRQQKSTERYQEERQTLLDIIRMQQAQINRLSHSTTYEAEEQEPALAAEEEK